jgi:hypothetical protein
MAQGKQQIVFQRAVLLVEIERRCADERCNTKNRIGLTKAEARSYQGFNCVRCERWQADALSERDIPDWWEELTLTGLAALRPRALSDQGSAPTDEMSEVVTRLSTAWRKQHGSVREGGARADEGTGRA